MFIIPTLTFSSLVCNLVCYIFHCSPLLAECLPGPFSIPQLVWLSIRSSYLSSLISSVLRPGLPSPPLLCGSPSVPTFHSLSFCLFVLCLKDSPSQSSNLRCFYGSPLQPPILSPVVCKSVCISSQYVPVCIPLVSSII